MLSIGAFRDAFIATQDDVRSVYRQRDYRRELVSSPTTAYWYRDFADASYVFSGSLSADGLTIAVANYVATSNPGSLPPYHWVAPVGTTPPASTANASASTAVFAWVVSVTQGGTNRIAQADIVPSVVGSATSPVSIVLSTAMAQFDAGAAVEVVAYAPIICRVQYAPFAMPGSWSQFGDVLMTMERCQPGSLVGRFYGGKRDAGNANENAIGGYFDTLGITRALMMQSVTTSPVAPLTGGLTHRINYEDLQRLSVPSERSTWETIGFEWWEGNAWQPLAVKAVSMEKRSTDNAKAVI